ncbi:MAG: DUF1292 domain-containing protein [Bacilli bacterium]|nr:DUF1292 domain-containing protein [Bacilli bacterium]
MAKLEKEDVKNLDKIKVKNSDGTVNEAEILLCFELESTGKSYILYTFDEVDDRNMETIHASTLSETKDGYQLDKIPDNEWKEVKEVMREIIRNEE